jgi:hypothetical protein
MRNVKGQQADRVEIIRRGGRYLDVSPAVSAGRLVVLAQSDGDVELPFPFEVDGDKIAGRGTTFYQFILPLDHTAGTEAPTTQPSEELVNQQQPPAPPHTPEFDPSSYAGDGSDLTPQQKQDWFLYRRNPGAYRRVQQMREQQRQQQLKLQQQQQNRPGPSSSAQPTAPAPPATTKKTTIAAAPLNVEAAPWPQ